MLTILLRKKDFQQNLIISSLKHIGKNSEAPFSINEHTITHACTTSASYYRSWLEHPAEETYFGTLTLISEGTDIANALKASGRNCLLEQAPNVPQPSLILNNI